MVIFPLAPDQTIAQMWSNGARGGEIHNNTKYLQLRTFAARIVRFQPEVESIRQRAATTADVDSQIHRFITHNANRQNTDSCFRPCPLCPA